MSFALAKIKEVNDLPHAERTLLSEKQGRIQRETLTRLERIALSRRIRGKYAHLSTSSDDFIARKSEEIALEDRRSRR